MQLYRNLIALLGRKPAATTDAFDDRLSRIGLREARRGQACSVLFRYSPQHLEA